MKFLISLITFCILVFSGCASATHVTDGLVASYDWSSDSGDQIVDSSGLGNNGTNVGSTLVDVGNGHKYRTFRNASSQYITVPASTSLDVTDKLTVEIWVKPSVYQDKTKNVYPIGKENAYSIKIGDTSGASVLTFGIRTATGLKSFGGVYPHIQNDNWHQIVCTYNGTSRTVKIYDDASVVYSATGDSVPTSISTSSNPLTIGQRGNDYGYFNGSVATVRIYNRDLSSDEIEQNYYNNFEDVYTYTKGDNPLAGMYIDEFSLGNRRLLGVDESGTLYVRANTSHVQCSSDQGVTWSTIFTDPDNHSIQQFHKFDSGRILLINYAGKIYVSDTNGQNFQLTYTMQNAPIARPSEHFGLTVSESTVWLADYTNTADGSGRYIYQSEDEGLTWNTILDVGSKSNFHFHDLKYDPYENLLWAVTGDGVGNHYIYYTDATTINWRNTGGSLAPQFTQIIPLPENVLFVTDNPENVRVYRWDRPQLGTATVNTHVEPRLIYTIAKTWNHAQAAYGSTAAIKYGDSPYAVFGLVQINDNQELPIQLFATSDGYGIHKVYDSGSTPTNIQGSSAIGVLATYTARNSIYASIGNGTPNGDYSVVYIGDGINVSCSSQNIKETQAVSFSATTYPKEADAYYWDFENDGTIDSTKRNTTHVFTNPGIYTVNLTVRNELGNFSKVKTDYITVNAATPIDSLSKLYWWLKGYFSFLLPLWEAS